MRTSSSGYKQRQETSSIRPRLTVVLLSGLAFCLLLLSGCNLFGDNATTSTSTSKPASAPTAAPTPTIDTALKDKGDAQLKAFQKWITYIQQDNGNASSYQQQYNSDQQALQSAKTGTAYNTALTTLNSHIAAIQMPGLKAESHNLQRQLQQQVSSWGQQHKYHNTYDHTDYPLGYEYGQNGIGGWAQDEISAAKTQADYQQAVDDLNMWLDNFQAMTTNSSDKTPYNQLHQSDVQLMQHNNKMNKKVVIISLEEQAVRVYDNGKLVKAFLATTGRPNKPSLPGTWWVEGKKSPTVFKAGVPKSSPDYYPDTPINYAMQYHSEGYFIHDAWWRANFGRGTNYPHADDSGDQFSSQGSHGCINLAKNDAGWLYGFVQVYTSIIIY